MHLGFLLLAALAALARSSCPGAVDALPSFDHVVMNEGAIPLQSDRLLDVWHTFKLTLPSARALRVKVNPSAQALADDWKVVLCPECPSADGSCLGVPFGHYWSSRGGGGAAGGRSRWQTAPAFAASAEGSQRALWNAAYNDQQRADSGWMFDVGVHDPALLARHGLQWFVAVQHAKAPGASNPNTKTEFRIFANTGASACTGTAGPAAGVDAQCFPAGGGAAAVVPYSTLYSNLGHRGLLPPAVEAIGSAACRAAATRVWCAQTHYKCGADGLAVKPCPLLCLQMQGGWGGAESAEHPCAALSAAEIAAVNAAVCRLEPPTDPAGAAFPGADSGSLTNFGAAGSCFGTGGGAPPKAPPHPCEPDHFACETPECYLTARPLACECVSGRDPAKGPECQLRSIV